MPSSSVAIHCDVGQQGTHPCASAKSACRNPSISRTLELLYPPWFSSGRPMYRSVYNESYKRQSVTGATAIPSENTLELASMILDVKNPP